MVYIRKQEPQEVIDHCLNCTKPYCNGNCEYTPEGKSTRLYKSKQRTRESIRLAQEADKKQLACAEKVSRMVIDGWREPVIARELGLTLDEVKKLIKLAQGKRWLY